MPHDPFGICYKGKKSPGGCIQEGKAFRGRYTLRNADEETLALSTNRKFLKIIDRSRVRVKREGAISPGKLRRRLGLEK
jgi:hypothetical protein